MAEKILIIDDDVDTLKLVGLMLQKQGYEILAASNGPQGLTQAGNGRPDLVLLDVMMPGMDGYEVARQLRANPATANIPILMFTAKAQLDDKVSGFEAGADDYLTKPTHPAELQAHVKALLARSVKTRASAAPPRQPTEPTAYMIGVLSARGGFGVSSVALNLAASLLPHATGPVVVTEMCPGLGTLGIELNITAPGGGLPALLNLSPADITRKRVSDELVSDPSGLKVLLSSIEPRDCALAGNVPQFEAIVNRLAYLGSIVLFDLGPGLPSSTQAILKHLSEVIVVTEPSPASVLHTRALYQDILNLGLTAKQVSVVANFRIRSDTNLSSSQVQDQLGQAVTATISPAPELMHMGGRNHTPAVLAQKDSLTAKQFTTLAGQVLGRAPQKNRQ